MINVNVRTWSALSMLSPNCSLEKQSNNAKVIDSAVHVEQLVFISSQKLKNISILTCHVGQTRKLRVEEI